MNTAERLPANRGSTINAYTIQTVTWYSCNHSMTPHTHANTHTQAPVFTITQVKGKFMFCISRVNKCLSVTTTFSTKVRIRIIEMYVLFKKGDKKNWKMRQKTQISIVEVRVGRAQDWSAVWFGWSSMLLINKNLTQSTPWMTLLHRPPIFCHCCS